MGQVVTGPLITGWELAVALIGSSVFSTVAVYVLARFTKAFDAWGGERAKLLAQFQNLDKLIDQTRQLTTTTEVIKARVSDQLWDRQVRWTYKRDVWVESIRAIGRMRSGLGRLVAAFQGERQGKDWAMDEGNTAREEVDAANKDLLLQFDVAPIVFSSHSCDILCNVLRVFANSHPTSEQEVKSMIEAVSRELSLFQQEAKKDLGYVDPMREAA